MRSQAYETAAAVAVAQSDAARNDPSLITRDFTQPLGHAEGELSVETFTPCPLTASELIGGWGPAFARTTKKGSCSLSPGLGGVKADDPRCPSETCVVVSVRSETWADPVARQVILSTLADFEQVCASARAYGPNTRFNATAAGCDHPERRKAIRVAIEVKPRLFRPCSYEQLTRDERHYFRKTCTNPGAALVMVD
jgi:hypothetical protein